VSPTRDPDSGEPLPQTSEGAPEGATARRAQAQREAQAIVRGWLVLPPLPSLRHAQDL
jgi:hypothetical protein